MVSWKGRVLDAETKKAGNASKTTCLTNSPPSLPGRDARDAITNPRHRSDDSERGAKLSQLMEISAGVLLSGASNDARRGSCANQAQSVYGHEHNNPKCCPGEGYFRTCK